MLIKLPIKKAMGTSTEVALAPLCMQSPQQQLPPAKILLITRSYTPVVTKGHVSEQTSFFSIRMSKHMGETV